MKPPPFAYHAPATTDEALALLTEHGSDAKLMAGGQSLIPTMNFRLAQPAVLIDLGRTRGLDGLAADDDGTVRIGAMCRQRAVERSDVVRRHAPLVHETMRWIAHPQIRNRGTIGGSIAHADPAAELPAVVAARGARLHVRGPSGERSVNADNFFTGLFATALAPDEILTEIVIPPLPARTGVAFEEIARRHGDFALVGAAVVLTLDEAGSCADARIALLSVGDGPVLANGAATALHGRAPDASVIRDAARIAGADDIDPPGDLHASPAYRRQLATVLTERALTRAVARARDR